MGAGAKTFLSRTCENELVDPTSGRAWGKSQRRSKSPPSGEGAGNSLTKTNAISASAIVDARPTIVAMMNRSFDLVRGGGIGLHSLQASPRVPALDSHAQPATRAAAR